MTTSTIYRGYEIKSMMFNRGPFAPDISPAVIGPDEKPIEVANEYAARDVINAALRSGAWPDRETEGVRALGAGAPGRDAADRGGVTMRARDFGDVVLCYHDNGAFDRGRDAATLARDWLRLGPEAFQAQYKFDWTPSDELRQRVEREAQHGRFA